MAPKGEPMVPLENDIGGMMPVPKSRAEHLVLMLFTQLGVDPSYVELDGVQIAWNIQTNEAEMTWTCKATMSTPRVVKALAAAGIKDWQQTEVDLGESENT